MTGHLPTCDPPCQDWPLCRHRDTPSGGCKPRMSGCKATCGHRQIVENYRAARHAAELQREQSCYGYATEEALHGPIVTFKTWLKALATT